MAPSQQQRPGENAWYIDTMRTAYQAGPESVDPSWRRYFATEHVPVQLRPATPPIPVAEPPQGAEPPLAPIETSPKRPGRSHARTE